MGIIKTKLIGTPPAVITISNLVTEVSLSVTNSSASGTIAKMSVSGTQYGGPVGVGIGTMTLLPDKQYINTFTIRYGVWIDSIGFSTNVDGLNIGGGGTGGVATVPATTSGIRVLGIGARSIQITSPISGTAIDFLAIRYIENYIPSITIEENVACIIGYAAPNTPLTSYTDSELKYAIIDSYLKTIIYLQTQSIDDTILGEFYVKACLALAPLGITVIGNGSEITLANMKAVLETVLQPTTIPGKKTVTVPSDSIGIITVRGTMMRFESNGKYIYWMFPTTKASYDIIPLVNIDSTRSNCDLTGKIEKDYPTSSLTTV
jgi:hypothetical protein